MIRFGAAIPVQKNLCLSKCILARVCSQTAWSATRLHNTSLPASASPMMVAYPGQQCNSRIRSTPVCLQDEADCTSIVTIGGIRFTPSDQNLHPCPISEMTFFFGACHTLAVHGRYLHWQTPSRLIAFRIASRPLTTHGGHKHLSSEFTSRTRPRATRGHG